MPIAAPQVQQQQKLNAGLRVPGAPQKVDPLWLAIAAGDMHREGSLFMPSPSDPPQAQPQGPARASAEGTSSLTAASDAGAS